MTVSTLFLLFSTVFNMFFLQDLNQHHWNDRVVIIMTENQGNEQFQQQLTELSEDLDGLDERKLVVYNIMPDKFQEGIKISSHKWQDGTSIYGKHNPDKLPFKVVLIGLDGGVKLDQKEVLKTEKLFATIDSMPMRQAEMRKSGKQ